MTNVCLTWWCLFFFVCWTCESNIFALYIQGWNIRHATKHQASIISSFCASNSFLALSFLRQISIRAGPSIVCFFSFASLCSLTGNRRLFSLNSILSLYTIQSSLVHCSKSKYHYLQRRPSSLIVLWVFLQTILSLFLFC